MDVKLDDSDFERLAAMLERRIADRVIARLQSNPAHDAMCENARTMALAYINQQSFNAEAVDAMKRALNSNSGQMLRDIVTNAVRSVHADDPDLKKAVARGVYEEARNHAERLRSPYDD